jgi:hypothetical protein
MADETYLYDGLYASFDGFQIKLRAPREEGDHVVYLEPRTYDELRRFGLKIGFELPDEDAPEK